MVKTKFTRNGREVMIYGAMRNFDYGSDEAVQESKKGGERDASVSLSSPERSRIRKSVEGISMLASTEASKASKTRRGTSYGSPSPEKATRRGSTLSPRVAKKQKVNVAPSGDDREEWPESEMLASTVAKKTRRGTSYGGSPVSPRQSKKQKVNSEKSLGDDGDDREEFLQIVTPPIMVIIHSGLVLTRTCSSRLQPPYLVLRRRFSGGATACSVSLNGKRNSEKEKVIVISGPTGAGKSRLALELAKRLNGEIISADSVQVPMSHFHLLLVCSLCSSTTPALLRDTTNSHRIHRRILTTRTHHAILEEGKVRIEILKDEIEENRA
ncbi:hypothetical protein F2Q69_00019074 [Brassica cretica]|uniref:Uncharacterized protein n=1 Tax=Brassica cretica TaxID=69181 RepID=A0A8S9Q2H4_BRACR|nr:hypothetical protein F2Q69_00019074 [Brassica cretica]